MAVRGHWIAIVVVTGVFAVAASADTLGRRRADPTARARHPAAASSGRALSRETAEAVVRAAALRVVQTIAATGRTPDGVSVTAAAPSTTQSAAEGIVDVARTALAGGVSAEPSAYCRATSAPITRTWSCDATVMRSVHRVLFMTFAVDDRGPRLERIQSMIGGW